MIFNTSVTQINPGAKTTILGRNPSTHEVATTIVKEFNKARPGDDLSTLLRNLITVSADTKAANSSHSKTLQDVTASLIDALSIKTDKVHPENRQVFIDVLAELGGPGINRQANIAAGAVVLPGRDVPSFSISQVDTSEIGKATKAAGILARAEENPSQADTVFSQYISGGYSGPEARIQKLVDEIGARTGETSDQLKTSLATSVLSRANSHPDEARTLFKTYINSDDNGPAAMISHLANALNNQGYQVVARLEPVLVSVLKEMAAPRGAIVGNFLVAQGTFEPNFEQVSTQNKLSAQTGLSQFSKDFERGISFSSPDGISLESLSHDEKIFIGRFANQQSVAAMVDPRGGELSLADRSKPVLDNTGFRLDGWNNATEGVNYQIDASADRIKISIPTTIAIKTAALLDVPSTPVGVATLELTMDRHTGQKSVHMSFVNQLR